jgi:hypothetical protein
MFMEKKVKSAYLTVRMTPEELKVVEETAGSYGIQHNSDLVRLALEYVRKNKPVLGKSFAPGSATA